MDDIANLVLCASGYAPFSRWAANFLHFNGVLQEMLLTYGTVNYKKKSSRINAGGFSLVTR